MSKSKKKKQEPEAADFQDSFDYDEGFNIDEVYDQWIPLVRYYFGPLQLH